MMADEEEEAKHVLQKLQGLVDRLYCFRDSYFETHSVEDAGRKQQDVQEEMEKTLQQMEEVLGMSTKERSPFCPSLKCGSAVLFLCGLCGILCVAALG